MTPFAVGGIRQEHKWDELGSGIYYGQLLEGKRDGYGVVYCTNGEKFPFLFECWWIQGMPSRGRYLKVDKTNSWFKYEGTFGENFQLSGKGTLHHEKGYYYEG